MRLTEKLHLLRIDFEIPVAPGRKLSRFVNVLIVFGDRITLIDTGVQGSEGTISSYLEGNGRHLSEIGTIVISHAHPDHIGSAASIKGLTGCRVLAHRDDQAWIEDIGLQNRERPVPGFFTLANLPVKVDGLLEDGQLLQVDKGITLQMIHSPGHSKGSLNMLFVEDRILFTADSIPLKDDIPNYDDYSALMNSLRRIKDSRDYDVLLTSWTQPLTDKCEIEKLIDEGENYILKLDRVVKETYTGKESESLSFCTKAVQKLGLPPFLVGKVVDNAFRSHLSGPQPQV